MKKVILAGALVAVALAAGWLLRSEMPDVATLRAHLAASADWQARHPWAAAAGFFLAYVAATALSLPVAVWMTLAGGALFGFWQALVLVSFASTLGATVAFLTARHLVRDWAHDRMGRHAAAIDAGLARDGAFYLFTLRLIPAVPFFALNLAMGLTPLRTATFWWVSQLGMLPATIVYTHAGTRLAQVESLGSILSPGVIGAFLLLGLLPWAMRLAVAWARRHRQLTRWPRPARFDRNLIVIGAGAAGLVAANVAAAGRASVTLIEARDMGGDCLNTGCVPSKALIRIAHAAYEIRTAARFGLDADPPAVRFDRVMARVREVIAEIAPHDSASRYRALGVEVIEGRARLVDPWTVEILTPAGETRRLTARAILLATGARPAVPPLPGLQEAGYLTSETLWDAMGTRAEPPPRLAVLGGGPVGCELAQAFARLGSQVVLIEAAPQILPREDGEAAARVRAALEADGVRVVSGWRAERCGRSSEGGWIEGQADGGRDRIAFDDLLVATGRTPRTEGLGLEALGIAAEPVIETDAWLRTRHPSILAAGDAAGPWQLTHASGHQGAVAALNALAAGIWKIRADRLPMPRTILSAPELAQVGLTETEAARQGIAATGTRLDLRDLDRAVIDGAATGFVKVLTPPGSDRILGVTIVGEGAGDMIAQFVMAMQRGIGLSGLLGMMHPYPSRSEAARLVAGRWRQRHMDPRLLALAQRYLSWRRG